MEEIAQKRGRVMGNSLLTSNRYYEDMGSTEKERQAAYRKFLLLDEPYSDMVTTNLQRV